MATKTFVSFNFKDRELVLSMRNFFQEHQGQIQGSMVICENDVSADGDKAIDAEILRVMRGCDAALFVIGDECHNSPWIRREATLAISIKLDLVVVRRPKTTGGEPPELRSQLGIPRVEWSPVRIGMALNQVGKTN